MTYADLKEALRILGLGERASLTEIKARHRELVKRYHPDAGDPSGDPDLIRKVNFAHKLLQEYLAEYRFSFSEEEFYEQNPEERLRQQFMNDPLWGKG